MNFWQLTAIFYPYIPVNFSRRILAVLFSNYIVIYSICLNHEIRSYRALTAKKSYMDWNTDELCLWFASIGFSECIPLVQEHRLKGAHLPDLSKDDMIELGIKKLGDRITVDNEINKLCGEASNLFSWGFSPKLMLWRAWFTAQIKLRPRSNECNISSSSAQRSCSVKCCIRLTTCWVLLTAARCCSMLVEAARCCSVLLGAVRCCSMLLGAARCCSMLLNAALPCLIAIKNVGRVIKIAHA